MKRIDMIIGNKIKVLLGGEVVYIVHDLYQNEIETFKEKEKAYKCYEQWKQNYYDEGWLPDESEGEIVVVAKVVISAKVVKDDIDEETGEQYYRFEDTIE